METGDPGRPGDGLGSPADSSPLSEASVPASSLPSSAQPSAGSSQQQAKQMGTARAKANREWSLQSWGSAQDMVEAVGSATAAVTAVGAGRAQMEQQVEWRPVTPTRDPPADGEVLMAEDPQGKKVRKVRRTVKVDGSEGRQERSLASRSAAQPAGGAAGFTTLSGCEAMPTCNSWDTVAALRQQAARQLVTEENGTHFVRLVISVEVGDGRRTRAMLSTGRRH